MSVKYRNTVIDYFRCTYKYFLKLKKGNRRFTTLTLFTIINYSDLKINFYSNYTPELSTL